MKTRTIRFIQFHNLTTRRMDDWSTRRFNFYILNDEFDSTEYYESEWDDELEEDVEHETTYDCVSYYCSLDDFDKGVSCEYMKKHRLKYTIIELEVNCDENDKPIWNVA